MKTRNPRKPRVQRTQPQPLIEVGRGENYRILFDCSTQDYAVEVNNQPVGWRADIFDAMRLVNEVLAERSKDDE